MFLRKVLAMNNYDLGLSVKTYEILIRSCSHCTNAYICSHRKMNGFCPQILAAARFYEALRDEA